MDIHIHVHNDDPATLDRLASIDKKLDRALKQGRDIMAEQDELREIAVAARDTTNEIAAGIARILEGRDDVPDDIMESFRALVPQLRDVAAQIPGVPDPVTPPEDGGGDGVPA